MFKLMHKNRKGLSLIELIVTIVVLGLVMGLAGMIVHTLTNSYNISADRWQVQNAVRLASTKFENNSNLIINSKQVDIFYDQGVAEGINYNRETGVWSWKGTTPVILPDATTEPQGDDYTYMYSTPAYDGDVFIGHLLFIRNDSTHAETNSVLFLNSEGFGDVPVQVEFSIGTNYLKGATPVQGEDESDEDYADRLAEAAADELDNKNNRAYQSNSTHVYFKSGNTEVIAYETDTIYVSENLAANKAVGMESDQLIYDADWLADDGATALGYPCGWSEFKVNSDGTATETQISGYPTSLQVKSGSDVVYTYDDTQIQQKGNVLRFLSPLSDKSFEQGTGSATQEKPTCLNQWLFDDMSALSETVLDNLRNFRDEVLRGTEFGDWFIHQYYYVWSPFLIENTAFLKPVYKAIMVPVSYVCDFVASL